MRINIKSIYFLIFLVKIVLIIIFVFNKSYSHNDFVDYNALEPFPIKKRIYTQRVLFFTVWLLSFILCHYFLFVKNKTWYVVAIFIMSAFLTVLGALILLGWR